MSGRISNLFTSLTGNTEKSRASASMYVDNASINALFELIQKHGKFYLKATKAGFEVGLGKYRFTIEDFMDLLQLTLHEVETLTREDADICAQLAEALLPHNEKPLQLQASALDDERRLWVAVNKFMKRQIKAFSQDQRLRFDFLTKKYAEKLALGTTTSNAEHDQHIAGNRQTPNFGGMMGGFLQTDTTGKGKASIYVENDALGFLMQLAIEYGNLEISFDSTNFMLSLNGLIFAFDYRNDYGSLRLISSLTLGAAEIMLKVMRFMYDDFEYDHNNEFEFETENEADEKIVLDVVDKRQDKEKFNVRAKSEKQLDRFIRIDEKFRKDLQNKEVKSGFSFSQSLRNSEKKNTPNSGNSNTPD